MEVLLRPLLEEDTDPLIGMFADEPELIDRIIEDIMQAREHDPLRQPHG